MTDSKKSTKDEIVTKKRRTELRKRWLAALRSGKYKQGYECLKSRSGKKKAEHCCLGVACEVFNTMCKEGVLGLDKSNILRPDKDVSGDYTYAGEFAEVPEALTKLVGANLGDLVIKKSDKAILAVVAKLKDGSIKSSRNPNDTGVEYSLKTLDVNHGSAYEALAPNTDLVRVNDMGLFDFNTIADIISRSPLLK